MGFELTWFLFKCQLLWFFGHWMTAAVGWSGLISRNIHCIMRLKILLQHRTFLWANDSSGKKPGQGIYIGVSGITGHYF
jgi:hypothetical protein